MTPEFLDRRLPAKVRGLAADLDNLWTHVRDTFAGGDPPAPGSVLATAHAFAVASDRRARNSWQGNPGRVPGPRMTRAQVGVASRAVVTTAGSLGRG